MAPRTAPFRSIRSTVLLLGLALACAKTPDGSSTRTQDGSAAAVAAAENASKQLLARADQGRIAGAPTAKVWIIEISDFQCPYCKMWHDSTYPAIVREYVQTGKARLAYLNYPLPNHANALPAAEAAMCASEQGKFWPMQSAIFDTQNRWAGLPDAVPVFDSLASSLGVALPQWRQCMTSHATQPLIAADQERSAAREIRSTPSFVIGDQLIPGAAPIGAFRDAIERALAAPRPTP